MTALKRKRKAGKKRLMSAVIKIRAERPLTQAQQIKWRFSLICALFAVISPSAQSGDFTHAELRDGHRFVIDYYQQELSAEAIETAVGDRTYALDFDSFDLKHSDPSIELSYRYRSGRWAYSARFFRFRGTGGNSRVEANMRKAVTVLGIYYFHFSAKILAQGSFRAMVVEL